MTEKHWKLEKMSATLTILLRCSFTFLLLLQLEGCHGQDGSNFFYFYSPTQRTMVNHGGGGALPTGNIFSSPFLNQQQQPQQQVQPTLPPFSPQQQQQQPALPNNLQYSSPNPLLGYQQTQAPAGPFFTTQQPLGHFQQFQQFGQQPQQNLVQQQQQAFNGFARFGQNVFANQQQAYLQPAAPTLQPQQQPQQHHQPGAYQSFYESPFQFLQQRYLQTPPSTSVPVPAPEQPRPATTVAPTLQPEVVVTPTAAPRRKQKISSRFRYVQVPQQALQYQVNPYTGLATPITSALPFTEQRYYSTVIPSVPTPTGYSFSLGSGTGSTSSVHVNMGPLPNNFQQHLTEITQIRRITQKARKPVVYEDQLAVEHMAPDTVVGAGSMMMSHDAAMMEATSEQPSEVPQPPPSPAPVAMDGLANMTIDTLLNEPSFQLETIAAPAPSPTSVPVEESSPNTVTEPDASAKINEANIPKRLAIRRKVARKRLRLDGTPEPEVNQGRSVDGGAVVVVPTGRRRLSSRMRIPQNQLSVDEPAKEYEGPQKGLVEESSPESVAAPSSTTPSPVASSESTADVESPATSEMEQPQAPEMEQAMPSSTTTTTTAQPPQSPSSDEQDGSPESMMPVNEAPASSMEQLQEMQEPIQSTPATPLTTTPSPSTTTTTAPTPVPVMPEEEMKPMMTPVDTPSQMMGDVPSHYYDYYDEYDDVQPGQLTKAIHRLAHSLVAQSAPGSSSESLSAELPVLEGAKKTDFPTVFRPQSEEDNSVETGKGEVITRFKVSQPAPSAMPTPSTTTTTTTTEATIPQVPFMNNDPVEEQPPPSSAELEEPVFQPLSTTEHVPATSTPKQPLSTTASPALPQSDERFTSSEEMEDSFEDEPEVVPNQSSSSSTTESPEMNEKEIATMPSSTESSQDLMQPQKVEGDQPEMDDNAEADAPSSSTNAPTEASSSTTEEMPMQLEEDNAEMSMSSEPPSIPSSSSTQSPVDEMNDEDDVQTVSSSSTTITPLPSPATTETPEDSSQEDFPQSNESSAEQSDSRQSSEEGEKLTSVEVIGKAQRLALGESLKRLRERQQSTTDAGEEVDDPTDETKNGTSSIQPKRKLRNYVRKPLQLANLTLPTSPPLGNINAVLDDGEGEHQSRHQVIQKIQRFRATFRTTTKRPRRVTRPSSTERLPHPDLDSFTDSSSSTSGPAEEPSSTSIYPTITTPAAPAATTSKTYLTSTTESITTMEPTTTTTTESTEMLTTTDSPRSRMTTYPSTTTPFTTTFSTDDFVENDNDKTAYNDEDDHVYYDEGHHDSTDPSSSTTVASSTGGSEMMYTTPSTSTTTTTSSTEGPFMTTTEQRSQSDDDEISTDITFSTTTTDIPLATTTTAGQLIIHEILPTMPPLKEVSFVIGESIEDQDQVIQSNEEDKQPPSSSRSSEEKAVVRVVKVSSSVSGEEGGSSSSQQITSEEASNEGVQSSTTQPPSTISSSSSVETTGSGRKVRVVIVRQRQRQSRNGTTISRRMTPKQSNRRRRKVIPRQLRRRS